MSFWTFPMGFGGGKSQEVLSFIGDHYTTDTGSSFTFTGVDIGAPDANRVVVIVVFARATSSRVLSSASIGGVAATIPIAAPISEGACAIICSDAPTGQTADIALTFNGATNSGKGIAVYRVLSTSATPADTDTITSGTTKTMNLTGGSVGIFAANSGVTSSISGYSNAVEDYDFAADAGITRAQRCGTITDAASSFSVDFSVTQTALIGACWV